MSYKEEILNTLNESQITSSEKRELILSNLKKSNQLREKMINDSLLIDEFGKITQKKEQELIALILDKKLFGFKYANEYFIPKLQLDEQNILNGIDKILNDFKDNNPLKVYQFLITPNEKYKDEHNTKYSPLQWLRSKKEE